ncbi:MAG: glycosyltransferase family 4 protein [Longimicrobiales bacterium]
MTDVLSGGPWPAERGGPIARVLIVGGDDVHKRIDLMKALSNRFRLAAAGSDIRRAEGFVDEGFPFFYYPMDRGANPINDARSYFFLAKMIRRLQPDLVHAFATKPAVWGRLAARRAGAPVVIGTITGLGSLYSSQDLRTRFVRSLYEPLQRRACHKSDLTIFQNERDLAQFIDTGVAPEQRSAIISGSGVRTEVMDPSKASESAVRAFRAEVGAKEGDVVVTMMTRLIRSKGVLEFARAAQLLRESRPNVRFALVGPDDQSSLDRLSSRELEEVTESVRWLGERSEVRPIYAGSDVFVLPSLYREGVPRVLLEAASMGLPLVTTRNPGCEAVVDEGRNGYLVEVGDSEALAQKIGVLVSHPTLRKRYARESREIAVRRFDLRVVVEATATHYQQLLAAAGRPFEYASDEGLRVRRQPDAPNNFGGKTDTGTTRPTRSG